MKLKIDENCELTNEHVGARYGIPVLHLFSDDRGYGPSQKTFPEKLSSVFGDLRAAHRVYSWARNNELTPETEEFVKLYLGQWPEGPQI